MFNLRGFAQNWLSAIVDPRRALGALKLPRYFIDWRKYDHLTGKKTLRWKESFPCLTDWVATTPFDPHYFYQTHWAVDRIIGHLPRFHVDIGSSTFFVSAASAFVALIFVDYRSLRVSLPGFQPMGGDLTGLPFADKSVPSLSCLHVVEHVGLGRYGDWLDPMGSVKAASELSRVLQPNGQLLLSTPVGRERIQFNAHRVFAPSTVISMLGDLQLRDFALVDDGGIFYPRAALEQAARCEYGCGMFEFIQPAT